MERIIQRPNRDLRIVHLDECFEVCYRNAVLDSSLRVHLAFTSGMDGTPDWDLVKELDKVAKQIYGLSSRQGYINFRERAPEPGAMCNETLTVVRRMFSEGRI